MKKKKKLIAIISSAVAAVIVLSVVLVVVLQGSGGKKDAITIMTEEMSGLFNPFYATSGSDQDVVGMTQIGMLSTDYINGEAQTVAGDEYPTVVKAFTYEHDDAKDETVYKFVIKNGLKFSDGEPLTMNDVMFNIYEYLDPVYTGSSTMYSIKIKGLNAYRTQTEGAENDDGEESLSAASGMAYSRRLELVSLYETMAKISDNSYDATPAQMENYIKNWSVSATYKNAFNNAEMDYNAQLQKDYEFALKTFKEEIENDYKAAKESFDLDTKTSVYYKHRDKLANDVYKFFVYEGYITPKYATDSDNKKDKNNIEYFENESYAETYDTMEKAIDYVYSSKIQYNFNQVITSWGTASTMLTQFEADARSVILNSNGGSMAVANIEGIKSLGHSSSETEVVVEEGNGKTVGGDLGTYKIAKVHKPNGEPENSDEYDVLQITIEGTDPKAIYNFGFTVAPQHYYAANDDGVAPEVDIEKNKFGLKFADSDFQTNVIQSQRHVRIPVGAGPYAATDKNNSDTLTLGLSDFNKDNTVYFKANHNFMFTVKCEKLRFLVVSSSNAIDKLENGEVDYISPQLTEANYERLEQLSSKGIKTLSAWQLGYGYIGINAGKVPNINVRRAIMSAMQTSLVMDYYKGDSVQTIQWPMSKMSWAYPVEENGAEIQNKCDYTKYINDDDAKEKIKSYTKKAQNDGVTDFKITFTIAGSSITEHPTYNVFKHAQELLNSCGWDIEVKADSQALTKLATGSLSVWAAAWGSTIDPDMYQVYHKNSTATSVYAWGYREIKNNPSLYEEETKIINELSDLIDEGRETNDRAVRKVIYQEAMELVLELAVEMPVYQRKNLYAYNTKTVKGFSEEVNPYSSPLEKVWELELIK